MGTLPNPVARDPRPSQINNVDLIEIALTTWCRIHNVGHVEATCPKFACAINMLQQERNNWEITQPDEFEPLDTYSDTLMFEVYTTTEDEIEEEEVPETILVVS